MTIAVMGEALVDLIPGADGGYRPHPGGSPYNVAIALGRQGVPAAFVSPLSNDGFGALLAAGLRDAGVAEAVARSDRPTALAVVTIDAGGQPSYAFYREGVADRDVTAQAIEAALPADLEALHTGSLALVPADLPRVQAVLGAARARGALLAVDANLRVGAVPDADTYTAAVDAVLPQCHLIKASDEDLAALGYLGEPIEAARALARRAPRALIALTLGAAGAALINATAEVRQPARPVETVADTVGAGDCFHAGLIARLRQRGWLAPQAMAHLDAKALDDLLRYASITAALNIERAGCDPPARGEVEALVSAVVG